MVHVVFPTTIHSGKSSEPCAVQRSCSSDAPGGNSKCTLISKGVVGLEPQVFASWELPFRLKLAIFKKVLNSAALSKTVTSLKRILSVPMTDVSPIGLATSL